MKGVRMESEIIHRVLLAVSLVGGYLLIWGFSK
jgi:hypothetical protein